MDITEFFDWRGALRIAQGHAQAARFDAFLHAAQQVIDLRSRDTEALLAVASLLSSFGYVGPARQCCERAFAIDPDNPRATAIAANLARDCAAHAKSRRLYAALVERFPTERAIRHNALMSLEYDPAATDSERLASAQEWGAWLTAAAGGPHPRPRIRTLNGRPLRVGYVSADFCQHTVGLFVKDVLAAHDRRRVSPYAYSAGKVNDWVTSAIQTSCAFRDVATMDDFALAKLIQQDEIDVLVDLSGHTAGSRLGVFAYRPAPLQVSWLGYFATTGLSVIDAVLLDDWHAPPGIESQFVEQVVRLEGGRFCYTPVPFTPSEVAPPPSALNGRITFGSFNNTGKLNDAVLALWARVLANVPDSRLVLKWRTFQDPEMCQSVHAAFERLGIAPERIELRGASFHAELLKEYADIDIALDPFPFSGGMTSCEALWMGVPVVTWPQSRVVSRQTLAFVSAIGLPELAAKDSDDYVRIAVDLARNHDRLQHLRSVLRVKMRESSLCDVTSFANGLEYTLHQLIARIAGSDAIASS